MIVHLASLFSCAFIFFFFLFFNKNKFNFFLEFHEKFRIDALFFENITKDIFFLKECNGREKYISPWVSLWIKLKNFSPNQIIKTINKNLPRSF